MSTRVVFAAGIRRPAAPNLAISAAILAAGLSLAGCGLAGGSGAGMRTMTITPSSASFGNVTVKTDATQTIKVANTGKDELKIFSADIMGAGFSLVGLTAPTKLATGASVNFNVTFKPMDAGAATGTVSIKTNAGESPATINLTGTGVEQSIKLTTSETSLTFGSVSVNNSATKEVAITNSGNSSVTITEVTASGVGFSASGGSNVTLSPNQSVSVNVNFAPKTNGSLSGTLTVASNAPTVKISLGGTGMQAQGANHSVGLTWSPSTSPVIGYFVYRRTGASGSFSKLDSVVDSATSFTDSNVTDGATYLYVVTAVSAGGGESQFSAEVSVTIPGS